MARSSLRLAVSAAAAVLLTGCAASQDYPSLARRPAERISGSVAVVAPQPVTPAPPPVASPEFSGRLAQLVEQARGAHARFVEERPRAERLVSAAGGAAVASESWAVASVALASLESARSDAMIALAELDQAYAAEAIAAAENGNAANRDAAGAARDQVVALVSEEDQALARLRGRLRS